MKRIVLTISGIILMCLINVNSKADDQVKDKSPIALKGKVYDVNGDGIYDFLTFGIVSPASRGKYSVDYIEIAGMHNEYSVEISDFYSTATGVVNWYFADISSASPAGDFLLKIHIKSQSGGGILNFENSLAIATKEGAPQDPDETVLILKYP